METKSALIKWISAFTLYNKSYVTKTEPVKGKIKTINTNYTFNPARFKHHHKNHYFCYNKTAPSC